MLQLAGGQIGDPGLPVAANDRGVMRLDRERLDDVVFGEDLTPFDAIREGPDFDGALRGPTSLTFRCLMTGENEFSLGREAKKDLSIRGVEDHRGREGDLGSPVQEGEEEPRDGRDDEQWSDDSHGPAPTKHIPPPSRRG